MHCTGAVDEEDTYTFILTHMCVLNYSHRAAPIKIFNISPISLLSLLLVLSLYSPSSWYLVLSLFSFIILLHMGNRLVCGAAAYSCSIPEAGGSPTTASAVPTAAVKKAAKTAKVASMSKAAANKTFSKKTRAHQNSSKTCGIEGKAIKYSLLTELIVTNIELTSTILTANEKNAKCGRTQMPEGFVSVRQRHAAEPSKEVAVVAPSTTAAIDVACKWILLVAIGGLMLTRSIIMIKAKTTRANARVRPRSNRANQCQPSAHQRTSLRHVVAQSVIRGKISSVRWVSVMVTMGGLMSSQLLQQVGAAVCNTNGDGSTPKCCNIIIPTLDPATTTKLQDTTSCPYAPACPSCIPPRPESPPCALATCNAGTFAGIERLTNLEVLGVSNLDNGGAPPFSKLSGKLPLAFFSLVKLRAIVFGRLWSHVTTNMEISGTLPGAFGQLTKLTYLEITNSKLSGSIPKEIGLLTNLRCMDWAYNKHISGTLPELSGLVKLTNLSVQKLSALSGTLPPGYGSLVSLKMLAMSGTQISGTIPTFEPGFVTTVTFSPQPAGPGELGKPVRFGECQSGSVSNVHFHSRSAAAPTFKFFCAKCDVGKFVRNNECVPCDVGKVSNVIGLVENECTACGTLMDGLLIKRMRTRREEHQVRKRREVMRAC